MGDAGSPPPPLHGDGDGDHRPREVTVLVTGFGPFKSFTLNPSHLITMQLPRILLPETSQTATSPIQPIIHMHIYPPPLRVSYATISQTLPSLLYPPVPIPSPDYVIHIGMAAGRHHYALETLAHRDGYTIKDIDDVDGIEVGSKRWASEGCPTILEAGWDRVDVLERWRVGLKRDDSGATPMPDVRLSTDPGRFLCDFIFYESLSERWKEAQSRDNEDDIDDIRGSGSNGAESLGKVAFLHVPGDTNTAAIDRGVRVTVAAIRAIVASWEDGYRREGSVIGSPGSGRRDVGVEFRS